MRPREYTVLFPFCGLGAGARGFLDAQITMFGAPAVFRSVGGIDVDPLGCADFEYLTDSPALCVDIAKLSASELRAFAGDDAPDVIFMSPPCKSFSGLLSKKAASSPKYEAMSRLVVDWTRLMLDTWLTPPKLVLLENVPRIASRGRFLLDEVQALLKRAGYLFHEGSHDCGELGGLAQHRRRFLLVARHPGRAAPLLYQPPSKRVRACGEVIGPMPMPEDPRGGPMHALPKLSWLNWVRLALIPAGGDWRDLEGVLADGQARREVHRRHRVEKWDEPSGTVAGSGSNSVGAVADPRPFARNLGPHARSNIDQVLPWDAPASTVTGAAKPSSGAPSIADPRLIPQPGNAGKHHGKYRVEGWTAPAHTVTGAGRVGSGAPSIADPRLRVARAYDHGYGVLRWDEPSSTVAGGSDVGQGAYSVADVRVDEGTYRGSYGVMAWDEAAATITGNARPTTGSFSVADPRKPPPSPTVIIAADGTWHRPLTTLELAALQGMPTVWKGAPLKLAGSGSTAWRERIGNAVPCPTARAIAEQMLVCLVAADAGGFSLSSGGSVWVERRLDA
jgi:site-specific DNA-cytosine methylase